jgi:branched-chain amino acid transport system ATP-binding protein
MLALSIATRNTMSAILSVHNVSKSFGQLLAVDDVSFVVDEGEIYGIAGPNGAGKTTVFNLISGIPFHTDRGQIAFQERSIEAMPPYQIYHLGVARTFQKETAFDTLTVEQNIRVSAVFGRAHQRETVGQEVTRALNMLDLSDVRQLLAGDLPLYTKKRLMIASAIVSNPKLLMLDEPAGGLSALELAEIERLILSLRNRGITIIIIEHVLPLLFGVSDRVMIMDFGQKIAEGPPQSVARDDVVIEAYLGQRGKEAFHAPEG